VRKWWWVYIVVMQKPKRVWSSYQENIFKDIREGQGHTVVIAVAGSGKTSTLVEGFKHIPKKIGNERVKTLMIAFNKSVADELRERAPSYVDCMTLHSLGFRAIKNSFGKDVKLNPDKTQDIIKSILATQGYKGTDKNTFDTINSLKRTVSLCKGYLFDIPSKIDELMDRFDIDNGLLDRDVFIRNVCQTLRECKNIKNVIDYDDMVYFPFIFNLPVGKWHRVCIDETQDLNASQIHMALSACKTGGRILAVGDPKQCVDENTILQIEDGTKLIKDIEVGEKILSYENGNLVFKPVVNKVKSSWENGIKITTKLGKSLTMSPNHKIWAEQQCVDGKFLVYLMYRSDLGFRVGKTNKWKAKTAPLGNRAVSEQADKLWVLEVVDSNEEAIWFEEWYSLSFGVPTAVFNGTERGLNQDRINMIFKVFGHNGFKVLEYKGLLLEYPHWTQRNSSVAEHSRYVVRINAHTISKRYSTINFEFSDPATYQLLMDNGFNNFKRYKRRETDREHFSYRKCNKNYSVILDIAQRISSLLGANLTENINIRNAPERDFKLITASGLFIGMKVLSNINGEIIDDEIINIEKINGVFYDIEVADTHNFIGNDILSHNSLYAFRGADSNAVNNVIKQLNAKVLPLSISYRCAKNIVRLAQKLVPEIEYHSDAKEGEIISMSEDDFLDEVKTGDFILSRINAPLIYHCLTLLKKGVRANIKGRDIGASLSYMIKKSEAKTIPEFKEWLDKWERNEIKRLQEKGRDPIISTDKASCLRALLNDAKSLEEVKNNLKELFTDGEDQDMVILSSIHRAKGDERERVFLLTRTLRRDMSQEEKNCEYVAITRSKSKLFLVK